MTSFFGAGYFLFFVDDFSKKMWVYFLKLKSYVFNEFKKFKTLTEKQFGKNRRIAKNIALRFFYFFTPKCLEAIHHTLHLTTKWIGGETKLYHYGDG